MKAAASLVKVTCTLKHETAKAILISADSQDCWLPKSLIEIERLGEGDAVISVPDWLAIKHGLT